MVCRDAACDLGRGSPAACLRRETGRAPCLDERQQRIRRTPRSAKIINVCRPPCAGSRPSTGSISQRRRGSGRNGRITRRNVSISSPCANRSRSCGAGAERTGARARAGSRCRSPCRRPQRHRHRVPEQPAAAPPAGAKTLPFTRIRKLTAEHMVRSKATSPHVLQAVEVDFHRVDQRAQVRARSVEGEARLLADVFAVHRATRFAARSRNSRTRTRACKATASCCTEEVNLGIAVDLGAEGLVAPVIKCAQTSMSRRAARRSRSPRSRNARARTSSSPTTSRAARTRCRIRHVRHADHGADHQSAAGRDPLDRRRAQEAGRHRDVRKATSIAIRPVGVLAQSFDHRAVDGAYSAAFLDRVRKLLENERLGSRGLSMTWQETHARVGRRRRTHGLRDGETAARGGPRG